MATDLVAPDLQPILDALRARRRANDGAHVATMTFVLFFENGILGDELRKRVHKLTAKHPSRVIVLDGSRSDATVALRDGCADHDDCPPARGEWIEFDVGGLDPQILRSSVAALALSDAPVILFWVAGGIDRDARLDALTELARTVVLGSSAMADDASQLDALLAFANRHPRATLCDMAYLRLQPWQEAIARFFDRADCMDDLGAINRVEIASGSEAEAYYLLGWLASRLDWMPLGESSLRNRRGATVDFVMLRDASPRTFDHISLHSPATSFLAQAVEGDGANGAIALTVTGATAHPARVHPLADTSVAALVERAILRGADDRVFRETLLAVTQIRNRRKE